MVNPLGNACYNVGNDAESKVKHAEIPPTSLSDNLPLFKCKARGRRKERT